MCSIFVRPKSDFRLKQGYGEEVQSRRLPNLGNELTFTLQAPQGGDPRGA